jgi:hypothetical protein
MKYFFGLALLAAAPFLAGCVTYSSSEAVRVLPEERAARTRIAEITIQDIPPNVSAEFRAMLADELRKQLGSCALGADALNLQVTVTELKKSDAGRAILIGDSNVIKGQARFVDPASGSVVGDYDVSRSVGGGGIAGALLMSAPENAMSQAFANELCSNVFPASLRRRR